MNEIFSKALGLAHGVVCHHCQHVCDGIQFTDQTKGPICLCNDCLGYYHINVNAEPHKKPVVDAEDRKQNPDLANITRRDFPVEDVAQARMDRIESEKHDAVDRQETRRRKAELVQQIEENAAKREKDIAMSANHIEKAAGALGVALTLILMEKLPNVTWEKTVQSGDQLVTERIEVRDDG